MNQKSVHVKMFVLPPLFVVFSLAAVVSLFVAPGSRLLTAALIAAGAVVYALTATGLVKDYRDLNHWYEQILDFVYLPMSITDMKMNWTFINKPVKDIIGKTRGDVLGRQCSEWNADICNTEKCGIAMLRKGMGTSFFTNEGVDRNFQVDTTWLYDRRKPDRKIGHLELVSDVTTKARLDKAVEHLRGSSEALAKTIEEEAATTEELSSTSEEFAKTLGSIRENIEKQNHKIEETVSSLEEMSASIQAVARTVSTVNEATQRNVEQARDGEEKIREAIRSVTVIGESLHAVSGMLESLSAKTERIDEVLKVINDIASRTNLLAMNAAIEAAHAGAFGKGFSVVASEIRKLAENAQVSARQIDSIVKEIKAGVHESAEHADRSSQMVAGNVRSTEQSLTALEQIIGHISDVNRMTTEVHEISGEQANVANEVLGNAKDLANLSSEIRDAVAEQSMGVTHMAEALHQLATNTQENARSAESLKEISHKLRV